MKCKMENCNGEIPQQTVGSVHTSCHTTAPVLACSKCGRLHWSDGSLTVSRVDGVSTFMEGNHFVNRDSNGVELSRF